MAAISQKMKISKIPYLIAQILIVSTSSSDLDLSDHSMALDLRREKLRRKKSEILETAFYEKTCSV